MSWLIAPITQICTNLHLWLLCECKGLFAPSVNGVLRGYHAKKVRVRNQFVQVLENIFLLIPTHYTPDPELTTGCVFLLLLLLPSLFLTLCVMLYEILMRNAMPITETQKPHMLKTPDANIVIDLLVRACSPPLLFNTKSKECGF